MARIKVHELRNKKKAEIDAQLKELKDELAVSRAAQVAGGAAYKIARIKKLRKSVAQVLTVINQTQRDKLREALKKSKYLPIDLRKKRTRAIRQRLAKAHANLKTERELKKIRHFPQRVFAVRA